MDTPRPRSERPQDPHVGQPTHAFGPRPEEARGALILVHGRGGTAESMRSLYDALEVPYLAALAPQAAGSTWYPRSFLAPLEANQPFLASALHRLETLVADLLSRGLPSERIALLGFSQGACLTLEYAARQARRYGGVMGLTGGLIGPPGTRRDYPGDLQGTPIFLGTSDPDPHVPFERVAETRDVLTRMGATVELRRYAGMPHTINADEIAACRDLIERLVAREPESPR